MLENKLLAKKINKYLNYFKLLYLADLEGLDLEGDKCKNSIGVCKKSLRPG